MFNLNYFVSLPQSAFYKRYSVEHKMADGKIMMITGILIAEEKDMFIFSDATEGINIVYKSNIRSMICIENKSLKKHDKKQI